MNLIADRISSTDEPGKNYELKTRCVKPKSICNKDTQYQISEKVRILSYKMIDFTYFHVNIRQIFYHFNYDPSYALTQLIRRRCSLGR